MKTVSAPKPFAREVTDAIQAFASKRPIKDLKFGQRSDGAAMATFAYENRPYKVEILNEHLEVSRNDLFMRIVDFVVAALWPSKAKARRMVEHRTNSHHFTVELCSVKNNADLALKCHFQECVNNDLQAYKNGLIEKNKLATDVIAEHDKTIKYRDKRITELENVVKYSEEEFRKSTNEMTELNNKIGNLEQQIRELQSASPAGPVANPEHIPPQESEAEEVKECAERDAEREAPIGDQRPQGKLDPTRAQGAESTNFNDDEQPASSTTSQDCEHAAAQGVATGSADDVTSVITTAATER